jgi:hypothetical protein
MQDSYIIIVGDDIYHYRLELYLFFECLIFHAFNTVEAVKILKTRSKLNCNAIIISTSVLPINNSDRLCFIKILMSKRVRSLFVIEKKSGEFTNHRPTWIEPDFQYKLRVLPRSCSPAEMLHHFQEVLSMKIL